MSTQEKRTPDRSAKERAAVPLTPARIGEQAMHVGRYCKRAVIAIGAKADVAEAARRMLDEHVRFLVAFNEDAGIRRPVGVLTDRDIVRQAMARAVNAHAVAVEDVMTRQPMVANEDDDLSDLIQAMKLAGIRRVPVVDDRGALTGIITIHDVIGVISGLLGDISGSIKNKERQEWRARRTLSASPYPDAVTNAMSGRSAPTIEHEPDACARVSRTLSTCL